MEWDGGAEAGETWLEACSLLAERFVSRVVRKKGVVLNYGRDTLRAAGEYVREEFKNVSQPSQEIVDSFTEALAYVCRVILLNFGGKPVFYPAMGKVVVRNVAGLGILAFPNVWLNRVIHAEPPAMLEDYYDRVAWLVNRLKTNSLNMDEKSFWNAMRVCGYFHHISTGKSLLENKYEGGTVASFSYCPDCRKIAQVTALSLPYERLTELVELVKSIEVVALEPTRQPCSKCNGWSLPLGYSYSAVVTRESLGKSFLKFFLTPLLPGSEERILTLVVSSLGKGFMLSSFLEMDSENRVSKIGKVEESPLVEPGALLIFSSTPFCV